MNDKGQQSVKRARGEGGLIRRQGSNNWYILWRDASGRQHKESSGSEVKQVALDCFKTAWRRRERRQDSSHVLAKTAL